MAVHSALLQVVQTKNIDLFSEGRIHSAGPTIDMLMYGNEMLFAHAIVSL